MALSIAHKFVVQLYIDCSCVWWHHPYQLPARAPPLSVASIFLHCCTSWKDVRGSLLSRVYNFHLYKNPTPYFFAWARIWCWVCFSGIARKKNFLFWLTFRLPQPSVGWINRHSSDHVFVGFLRWILLCSPIIHLFIMLFSYLLHLQGLG